MTHQYNVTGMTCGSCVAKAKSTLLKLGDVEEADVRLDSPQATITMLRHIPTGVLQDALNKVGQYTITEADSGPHRTDTHNNQDRVVTERATWFGTYKPILLIGAYIIGSTLMVESVKGKFIWERWMQNFMAAFFLVFSFFKLLDLRGFADSYSSYDVLAKRWRSWSLLYPFVELALGVAYLIRFQPMLTSCATFVVMSVSLIGVLQNVLSKRKIQCACLGAVFNLPMSTITIVEDGLMILMSVIMLIDVP